MIFLDNIESNLFDTNDNVVEANEQLVKAKDKVSVCCIQ